MRLGLLAGVLVTAVASFASVAWFVPRASEPTSADVFARGIVGLIAENRYGQAWQRLHPSHQRSARYADYVMCEKLSPIPGRLISVTAGRVADERVAIRPGRLVSSKAVRVDIVLRDLAGEESTVVATTVHAVPFNGSWRWVLPQDRLADYAAGRCPS